MGSRGVKRIADVSRLRISQFSQVHILSEMQAAFGLLHAI